MSSKKIVILIHGLACNKYFMLPLARYLKKQGYTIYNWDYQSRKFTIEDLASQLNDYIIANDLNNVNINFVTYSMGAIILRYYAENYTQKNIDKVVMLGPPNHGSEIVDKLKQYKIYQKFFGPAGVTLGTKKNDIARKLQVHYDFDIGVIAGSLSLDPLCSYFLPKGNDGKVSIESTKLSCMRAHITLFTSHILMIFSQRVFRYTAKFLKTSSFSS